MGKGYFFRFELFILEGWFSKPFTYHNRRRESCDAGASKQVSIRVLDGTSNINNQFRRTRAWCMGWTVNPWLAEFDTQMRSQTIWAVSDNGSTGPLQGLGISSILIRSTKTIAGFDSRTPVS